jgi:glyoxylase-like metal-dependent hydrolase (beta-lactamase superfamily II)
MAAMSTPATHFSGDAPVPPDLDIVWAHGAPTQRQDTDPPIQTHWVDASTAVLRQSKAVSAEAPFLYLFLGDDRAILLDTGDAAESDRCDVAGAVEGLLVDWQANHPRPGDAPPYELVVAHTHAHHDHIKGDPQFAGRPATTVVGSDLDSVRDFFGFTRWPAEVVTFDLGGRALEITGIPGHHRTSIAVHDPWSGLLVTGDTVYPGRLYVEDMPAFVDSLERLVELSASRRVTAVMGCHLEMSGTSGRDFPFGARYQPDEAPLPMTVDQLVRLRDRARQVADRPGQHRFDDVVIYNGRSTLPMLRLVARGGLATARRRMSSVLPRRRGRS